VLRGELVHLSDEPQLVLGDQLLVALCRAVLLDDAARPTLGAGVVCLAAAPEARAARVIWCCIRLSDNASHAYLTESLLSATTEPNAAMTPTT